MPRAVVADDNEAYRALFAETLRCAGLEVATADDGLAALDLLEREQSDLVLLDVKMPRLDGVETCRRIKANPQTRLVPVVLITGNSDLESRVQCLEAGADDFFGKPVHPRELFARIWALLRFKSCVDELERCESVILTLARTIEAKDPYTRGHCERLSESASRLGARLGLPEEDILALRRAGVLHDIGKVAIPDSILLKRGPLTPEERKVMEQHTVAGEQICSSLKSFARVLPIIRHHHEKYDGSGYPDGLKGEKIPLTARVFQLADVYDALTTERSYKRELSPEEALAVMASEVERGWWDSRVYAELARMISESDGLY
ncbi:MAG TPA: HD domain-containing phosphohydrolase [Candidatus Xenobia bacterium]|nr:HD domain-containing phosphohydrolase [Candidatus Xenobia bacterium]